MGTATVAPAKSEQKGSSISTGGPEGGNNNGGGNPENFFPPSRVYRTGVWIALAPILMLFLAFTSALVVRKGLSNDWVPTPLPSILWLNTLVLLASSLTLEWSRQSLRHGLSRAFTRGLWVTTGLGIIFVAGQLVAWRQLVAAGVYLASNPSSSFFYVLTAAHGVHLLGGLGALLYLDLKPRNYASVRPINTTAVDATAIYWHFLDGLWIYILVVLLLGR